MLDVLALSPHPDDVELCCGGFIAKMSGKRHSVGIIDLTRGEMGTEGTAEARMQEALKAAEILKVKFRENMDFGDCRLSPDFEKARKLANVIRRYKPSIMIVPYGDDQHPDHAAAGELSRKAIFFAKLSKIKTGHQSFTVGTVAYYMLHKTFDPSFVVDVTATYDEKLASIKAYKSQVKLMLGIGGLLRSVELRDQFYGSKIGVKRGEPFLCDNPLNIDDPVEFFK